MNRFVAGVSTLIVAIACSSGVIAGLQAISGPVRPPRTQPTTHATSTTQVDAYIGEAACIELTPTGGVVDCLNLR